MKIDKFIPPVAILVGFSFYFAFDILTLKKFLSQADVTNAYFPYRRWFTEQLKEGNFPFWNPYWGLGQTNQWFLGYPLDIFTPLEIVFGPQYHYFQALQLLLVLGAVFYTLHKLGFCPLLSATSAVLFFMNPWVTHFYFYFFIAHSFIGNALLFTFVYLWFKTEDPKYLLGIAGATFLTMFGTHMEYWFFNNTAFVFYTFTAAWLYYAQQPLKTAKMIFLAFFFLALGILGHAWQLNLVAVTTMISESLGAVKQNLLFSWEMYENIFFTILESPFLTIFTAGLLFYIAINTTKGRTAILLAQTSLVVFYRLTQWETPLIEFSQTTTQLQGALFGFCISLALLKIRNWRDHLSAGTLYCLFIYYWSRTGSGDMGEMEVLRQAPWLFKFILSTCVWLGCMEVRKSKIASLAYLTIPFIFIMREHGQLVLTYFSGLRWDSTRDNYIIDYGMTLLAICGMTALVSFEQSPVLRKRLNYGLPLAIIMGVSLSAAPDLYYSHWMMVAPPPDYPYFNGIPEVRKTIHDLKSSSTTRVLLINKPTTSFTYGFGESLLEKTSQVTDYSTLAPRNYTGWALYKRKGILPEEKISIYKQRLSVKTLARMPKINEYGLNPGLVDFYLHTARPPLEINALRFLSIDYVIYFRTSMGDKKISDFDFENIDLDQRMKTLGLQNVHDEPGGYYFNSIDKNTHNITRYEKEILTIGRIDNPLPRSYLVRNVTSDRLDEFRSEMDVVVGDHIIKTKSFEFKFESVEIEKYENARVSLTVTSKGENDYLVLSDLNHIFWHVRLDGKIADIVPAFHLMRGVKIPPGKHQVEFFCAVPYLKKSLCISALAIFLSIAAFFYRNTISICLKNIQPSSNSL